MSDGLAELVASIGMTRLGAELSNQLELSGASSFTESANVVVRYLNEKTPLSDWSVTRVVNDEQVFVHVEHGGGRSIGDRVAWDRTFCKQMVAGGAHVVADSAQDPTYAELGRSADVRSYAGYTITDGQGELFGVLCGTRREPLALDETVDQELIQLLSQLLSLQLQMARRIDHERRQAAIAEVEANTDPLTGLLSRRGWGRILEDTQQRIDAFGDPVGVAVVDLDDLKAINDEHGHQAGDARIIALGRALSTVAGSMHRIARIGGDEFVILAHGVSAHTAANHFAGFTRAIEEADIRASLGFSVGRAGDTRMEAALHDADAEMYRQKSERKLPRSE